MGRTFLLPVLRQETTVYFPERERACVPGISDGPAFYPIFRRMFKLPTGIPKPPVSIFYLLTYFRIPRSL